MKYFVFMIIGLVLPFIHHPVYTMDDDSIRACKQAFFVFQKKIRAIYTTHPSKHPDSQLSIDLHNTFVSIMKEDPEEFCRSFQRLTDAKKHLYGS